MRIERLDIGDFGIFSNAVMKNIAPGIVVVGGLNRAGKTTLLQVLRHLGYGFPNDDSLPPAREKYRVKADYRLDNNDRFNLSLEGYGNPRINSLQGSQMQANIYSESLDYYTYQQLFTISLDELQEIPEGDKEQERLQSVLLGAGLADILAVQNISQELRKKAQAIGGKRGSCNVYEFSEYNEEICKGVNLREEALNEFDEYKEVQKKIEEVKEKIKEKEEELKLARAETTLLDITKSNFLDWERKRELELELNDYDLEKSELNYGESSLTKAREFKEDYQQIKEECQEKLTEFKEEVTRQNVEEVKDKFLEVKEELEQYYKEGTGLKERVKNFWERRQLHQERRTEIISEIKRQNENWHDLASVLNIKADEIEQDKLTQVVNERKELGKELKEGRKKLEELKLEEGQLQEQLANIEAIDYHTNMKKYFFFTVGFIGLGFGLFFISPWLGGMTGLAGVLGSGMYLLGRSLFQSSTINHRQDLTIKLERIRSEISSQQQQIGKLEDKLTPLKDKLNKYQQLLKLPEGISPQLIKESFSKVQDLKEKIANWKQEEELLKNRERKLEEKLQGLSELITKVYKLIPFREISWPSREFIKESDKLFAELNWCYKALKQVKELAQKRLQKKELEDKIIEFLPGEVEEDYLTSSLEEFILQCKEYKEASKLKKEKEERQKAVLSSLKTDRVRKAFDRLKDEEIKNNSEEKLLILFDNFSQQYTSLENVKKVYKETEKRTKTLEEELKDLRNDYQSLKDNREQLATSDKLEKAQKKIDRARSKLRPLAKKYAVNKAAVFLLEQIRERCIDKIKDELLNSASQILKKITQGEYQKLLPKNDLTRVDFKLELNDGSRKTIDILSRGTKEQVFLSVRLSRIREIKTALPVILDESLVNFDTYHLNQVVNFLTDLAKTHQIFVLTCQPHLIEQVALETDDAQYWKLEEGNFKEVDCDKLIDYLSIWD